MRNSLLAFLLLAITDVAMAQSRPASPIALKDLKGRIVRLTDFKGKVLLVNFWATWCPPCRAEIPQLIKWQRRYRSQGLQVIGVTYPPTERRAVSRFMRTLKINYPVMLGSKETKALFDSGETLPFSVVIDREGKIRETIEGIMLPEEFVEKVSPLLEHSKKDGEPQSAGGTPIRNVVPGLERRSRNKNSDSPGSQDLLRESFRST